MGRIESFRQYAAECVRQAEGEQSPEHRTIMLNIALAWVRLAQQSQATAQQAQPPAAAKTVAATAVGDAAAPARPSGKAALSTAPQRA